MFISFPTYETAAELIQQAISPSMPAAVERWLFNVPEADLVFHPCGVDEVVLALTGS
jgi:hypothetical protein